VLLTPGPTNVPTEIIEALHQTDHSHRDRAMIDSIATLRNSVVELLGGDNAFTCVPLCCAGSGAIEALVGTVTGHLLVLDAGRYSRRVAELARRCKVPVETLEFEPWSGIEPDKVDAELKKRPHVTDVFVVHLETTTGELAPLEDVGRIVHRHGRNLLVDAVSSAFGHHIDLKRDRITAAVVTPNKCLEGVPGVAMVIADASWLESLAGRARSYYFDILDEAQQLRSQGTPRFTMSPGLIAATCLAVKRARVEGIDRRGHRYRALRDDLRRELDLLGIRVQHPARDSNIITVLAMPDRLEPQQLVAEMATAGFVVHSHVELTARRMFGLATLGDLQRADVVRFAAELGKTTRHLI
jgi:2-aminoethylphosphonate-pyruvate transaminase